MKITLYIIICSFRAEWEKRENMYIRKLLAILGMYGVILCALCGCQKNTADSTVVDYEELPVIIVGSDNYPPFKYEDADGNATGIDVDLATEAFRRMGYKARFVCINWEDKDTLLANGSVDCVWGSFSINGRENEYRWAGPYMVSQQVVAVNVNSDIYKLSDLEDKTIAVQITTKPEELLLNRTDERIPSIRSLIALQDRELIYPVLSKGYVDGIAAHKTAIKQYMKDYDIEFRILDEPLLNVGLGVAFDKNDVRGLDVELTQMLNQMRLDGTQRKILEKYLDDVDEYLEVEDYEK